LVNFTQISLLASIELNSNLDGAILQAQKHLLCYKIILYWYQKIIQMSEDMVTFLDC